VLLQQPTDDWPTNMPLAVTTNTLSLYDNRQTTGQQTGHWLLWLTHCHCTTTDGRLANKQAIGCYNLHTVTVRQTTGQQTGHWLLQLTHCHCTTDDWPTNRPLVVVTNTLSLYDNRRTTGQQTGHWLLWLTHCHCTTTDGQLANKQAIGCYN